MEPLNVFLSHITQEVKLADILDEHIDRDFLGLVRLYNPSGLSQALDYAIKASGAPMRLYARQLNSIDLRVERSVGALEE